MQYKSVVADHMAVSAKALDANARAARDIMQAWSRPMFYSNFADISLAVSSSCDSLHALQ